MAILKGDITFVKSSVLDDVPEGGGAPTGNRVVDGQSNEIFSDISELDRAGGNVSLRKIFVAVETDNTDTYLDANVVVAAPPTDPNVSITLFSTNQTFDTRDTSRQRVEAYLTEAPEWAGFLLENHIAGQRVIQIFQRPSEALPNIGETLVLIWHEGLSDERKQFVRVIDTSSVERSYTNSQGREYKAVVVSAGISDALRFDFPGTAPNEFFEREASKSKVRETSVADAAVYCGVSKTVGPVDIGDLTASVQSVFTQLVPSAQTEIPLVDRNAAGNSAALTPAGDGTITYTTSAEFNATTSLSLGNPITPGTLTITIGATVLADTGGQLFDGATTIGTVDYARGTVAFAGVAAPYSGSKTISFKASAAPTRISDTGQVPVTAESRSFNYIVSVLPPPAPGSVMVSYRAQGRWYDLLDNGGGVVRGTDSSYGVGSVNYATGAIAVTLGVLPDVGSSVMFSWGTKVNYNDRSTMTIEPAAVSATLSNVPVEPGTLVIAWNDGTPRTASDDGKGVIAGSATGTIDYTTGLVKFAPTTMPLGGQAYDFSYESVSEDARQLVDFPIPSRNGDTTVTLDLGQTNIKPKSVKLSYAVDQPATVETSTVRKELAVAPRANAYDDGNGNIIGELGRVAGTINYTTGVITFQPDGPMYCRVTEYRALPTFNYVGMRLA